MGKLFSDKKEMKTILKVFGIVSVCFFLFACSSKEPDVFDEEEPVPVQEEETVVPDEENDGGEEPQDIGEYLYHYEFRDSGGNAVRLSDYEGSYVMVNFTASWCTYCVMEMPEYQQFAKENDVRCLFIMTPLNEENGEEDIAEFIRAYEPELPVFIDDEGVMFYYCGIDSFPTTFVIDPDGRFMCYVNGAMDKDGFKGLLDYAVSLKDS